MIKINSQTENDTLVAMRLYHLCLIFIFILSYITHNKCHYLYQFPPRSVNFLISNLRPSPLLIIFSLKSQAIKFMSPITVDKLCLAAIVSNYLPSITSCYPPTHATIAKPTLFSLCAPEETVSLDGNCIC